MNVSQQSFAKRVAIDFKRNKWKYFIVLPVLIYILIFCYKPMYGIIIAFKDYRPAMGISASPWVGLKHFKAFFSDVNFWRVLKNTLRISISTIVFGFPAPILLALMINEVKNTKFKKVIQTVTYLPHFVAIVIICGMIREFCLSDGLFNVIIEFFGGTPSSLLQKPELFVPIYVLSDIWQGIGWNSIIYLAAISGIDQEQYEAARVDGAGRLQQIIHITLPGIMPTVVTLLILRMGSILGVGYEKILLLYNPTTYSTADVISTYVYRTGLVGAQWSYSTAVGLFNSVVNVIVLVAANKLSKKFSGSGLF
ncbi:MAG: ABC transporter permease [Lachnospiraceae bacterium]